MRKRFRLSPFVCSVLVVMSGATIAKLLGFAVSPIISRLFSPADFGVFGSFSSVAGIIGAVVTLEYSQALMLPKVKDDALHLLLISCVSTLVVSAICLVICVVLPSTLNALMKTDGVWALALLVVATLVGGMNVSLQSWSVRVKAFKHTSASEVIRSASSNGMQIGLGCLKTGGLGLIVSSVLADGAASINLLRVLLPDLRTLRGRLRWTRMRELAHEYRDFPAYSASIRLINGLSLGLPVLLLAQYYGLGAAGAYAFALRVLQTPFNLLLSALRQVLFQKACEVHQQGLNLESLYAKSTGGLFVAAALPCLFFMIWAPALFAWVFGANWMLAGRFGRWIAVWLLFAFCNLPATLFARIIRMQRKLFVFNLLFFAARTIALVAGGRYLAAEPTIMLFSLVGAVMNLILVLMVARMLSHHSTMAHPTGDTDIYEDS